MIIHDFNLKISSPNLKSNLKIQNFRIRNLENGSFLKIENWNLVKTNMNMYDFLG